MSANNSRTKRKKKNNNYYSSSSDDSETSSSSGDDSDNETKPQINSIAVKLFEIPPVNTPDYNYNAKRLFSLKR